MNNRGQTLVMFILMLPLLLIVLCLVVDIGMLSLEKKKLENTLKDAIYYELNNQETDSNMIKNRLTNTLSKNINNIKIKKVEITDNKVITVSISKEYKGIFTKILKSNLFDITLTISSVKGGTGKTTTALNLAGVFANMNLKMLIIDLDLFSGGIGLSLNIDVTKNIFTAIDDMNNNRFTNLDDYIVKYNNDIDVLSAPIY